MRAPVGVAKAEIALTVAALHGARELLSPGRGRTLVTIDEADFGVGRPDLLVLTLSTSRLSAKARRGLRLRNFVEAIVLAAEAGEGTALSLTSKHRADVERRLSQTGWGSVSDHDISDIATYESLLLEAKVKDWRTGLAQLARARRHFSQAALLMPRSVLIRVPRTYLRAYAIGLIAYTPTEVTWVRQAPARAQALSSRLWLDELAIRRVLGGVVTTSPTLDLPQTGEPRALTQQLADSLEHS